MPTTPAVFRRRLALRAHGQQTRHDWLVIDACGNLGKLRDDVALLQSFRSATQANVEMLCQQLGAMLTMLDDQGLNDRFCVGSETPAAH